MSAQTLERLAALLRAEGGLLATFVDHRDAPVSEQARPSDETDLAQGPATIVAQGPRVRGSEEEYALLVEAIYEGFLLHYRSPRVVRPAEADLRLLAGDQLYAIGLARLVELGDTMAVAELADTIMLSALAQTAGEHALADAVWLAGARAVGWGATAAHKRAKELVLKGAPEAVEAMRTSAGGPMGPS